MLFTDDVGTIEAGYLVLKTVAPFYCLFAITQPLSGVMRGAGETVIPMNNSLMMNLAVRIPTLFLLVRLFNRVEMIYWSQVVGWFYGCASLLLVYRKGSWKKKAYDRIAMLQAEAKARAESSDVSEAAESVEAAEPICE